MGRIAALCVLAAAGSIAFGQTTLVGFDSMAESTAVGTQVAGATFTNAVVLQSGVSLNEIEYPPRSGSKVVCDVGGPMTIAFSSPVSFVRGYFTHRQALTIQAFDATGSVLATASSSQDNRQGHGTPNEELSVSSNQPIAKVTIQGAAGGTSFTMDDLDFVLPGTSSSVSFTPSFLYFDWVTGSPDPPAQTFSVATTPDGPFAATTTASWLQVTPTSSSKAATLTAIVRPENMALGTYSALVNINGPKEAAGSMLVRLRVLDHSEIFASPTSLSFSYKEGDPAPAAQQLYIGARSLNVFYFVQPNASWIHVSPDSQETGDLSKTIAVTIDASKLTAGMYQGTLSVISGNASNSRLLVPVTLTITSKTATQTELDRRN